MSDKDKTQPLPKMNARCFNCGKMKPVDKMQMNIPLWHGNINVKICFDCLEGEAHNSLTTHLAGFVSSLFKRGKK